MWRWLAAALNGSIDCIRTSHRELDARLAQRTAELREANESLLREVASRKAAETALACDQARLELALECAGMGAWQSDQETGELIWSDSVAQLFGMSAGEFDGRRESFYRLVHPDDRARVEAAFSTATESSGVVDIEHRIIRHDGAVRWVREKGKVVQVPGSAGGRAFGIVMDVTSHKQVEDELDKSQARITALVEHLPEGVVMLDGEGRVVLTNPLGRAVLADLGVFGPESRLVQLGDLALDEVICAPDERFTAETTDGTGRRRLFEVQANVPTGEAARPFTVLVVREVTKQREAEDRMQNQARLAAIGQLAAGIAHDFNNMLMVMNGFAQMLQMREDVPPDAREDLALVRTEGQRAAQLIRQILDFSRMSATTHRPVNLVSLVKETAKMLEMALPETIQVRLEVPDEDVWVAASPAQLDQAFTNLVLNARDAMPRGGRLEVSLSRMEVTSDQDAPGLEITPGSWAVWRVCDNGCGMGPHILPRIFEPFFTTKQRGEGTGLGLSQVYGIVKQHDGDVQVSSTPDEGTAVTIYLPVAVDIEADDAEAIRNLPAGQGETVLVVEDNASVLRTVRSMLACLNYRSLPARNGREALAVYKAHRREIDLVLSDMVMPGMGWHELLGALRQSQPDLKIVAMTGYSPDGKGNGGLDGVVAGFVAKPISLGSISQVVAMALGRTNAQN